MIRLKDRDEFIQFLGRHEFDGSDAAVASEYGLGMAKDPYYLPVEFAEVDLILVADSTGALGTNCTFRLVQSYDGGSTFTALTEDCTIGSVDLTQPIIVPSNGNKLNAGGPGSAGWGPLQIQFDSVTDQIDDGTGPPAVAFPVDLWLVVRPTGPWIKKDRV